MEKGRSSWLYLNAFSLTLSFFGAICDLLNLSHIDGLITAGASLSKVDKRLYRQLLIISELFRQQQWMYQQRQNERPRRKRTQC